MDSKQQKPGVSREQNLGKKDINTNKETQQQQRGTQQGSWNWNQEGNQSGKK